MRASAALLLIAVAAPTTARAQLTAADRAALGDLGPTFAERFELRNGWFRGRPVAYYDFGPASVTISPMFLVATAVSANGTPTLVPGQRPVFSSVPGVSGYSAIWQVHYVVVGRGYVANTLRDGREAVAMTLRGAARLVVPGFFVNCPIVPAGSSLADDPDSRPLESGWYKGAEVPFFDFGRAPLDPAPIYAFVTGFTAGEPQLLREQGNLVDVVPGGPDAYRDMWDVHLVEVGANYVAQSLRDVASLQAEAQRTSLAIRRVGSVRNCPVVVLDSQRAPRLAALPPQR